MKISHGLADALSRRLTVLIIPQTRLKPWRFQFTTSFFLFMLALWSGLTVAAGVVVGRHADYWITKADTRSCWSR